jgi:succinoglycan biosynthesis protein ExoM
MEISICVCTRRREDGLRRLLQSFEELVIPENATVRIIIVENDQVNSAEVLVNEFNRRGVLNIKYCLETKQGLVFARNRSVAEAGPCDFCCFTDDDQTVSPGWLAELVRCQREFNADGVAGPTLPVFPHEVPEYISSFHQPDTYPYGTVVAHAFTGCLMLSKRYLDMVEGPFETRLNFSGGEDNYLTRKITGLGGVLRFNPEAKAFETVPENRATVRFILRRKFRTSNTELLIKSINNPGFRKLSALPRYIARFCYGSLIFIPYLLFGGKNKLKGLLKVVNAIGGFAGIFGKNSEFYR